jgi:hypothetical protein
MAANLAIALLCAAACAVAQPSRDRYQTAYRSWRQLDPSLEASVASGEETNAQRAYRAAAEAAKYGAARQDYFNSVADELEQQAMWLQNSAASDVAPFGFVKAEQDYVAKASTAAAGVIGTLANDPDPGMQPLRQALESERASLTSLSPAIAQRVKSADAVEEASKAEQASRAKALNAYRGLAAEQKRISEQMSRENAAWATYYQKLADTAAAIRPPDSPPASATRPATPPLAATPPGPLPSTVSPSARGIAPAAPAIAPAAPASLTTLALARYTGAWSFPATNGVFRGLQPESADLTVRADNGHARGMLVVRFRLPPGSNLEPVLRFEFSGDFKDARRQVFQLQTSAGAGGTIELIPGNEFNLLEVNFLTTGPGNVRQGDFVLVRK